MLDKHSRNLGADGTITRTMVINIKSMTHVCSNTFLSIFLMRATIVFWKMSLLHWFTKLTHQTLYRKKTIGDVLWRQWCHGDCTLKTVSEIAFCFVLTTEFVWTVIRNWFTGTILVPIIIVITFITVLAVAVFIALLFLLLLSSWLCWCSSYHYYWCWCDFGRYCCHYHIIVLFFLTLIMYHHAFIVITVTSVSLSILLFYCSCFFVVLANAIIIAYRFLSLLSLLLRFCCCNHYYGYQSGCCYYVYCSY